MNIIDDKKKKINDVKILKAVLTAPSKSVYSLKNELEKEFGKKEANYPKILRHINSLEDEGFVRFEKGVRKNGKVDQRRTKNIDLTHKGLFKLILEGKLSDVDVQLIIEKTYLKFNFKKPEFANLSLIKNVQVNTIRKSFEKLKPMINLEYYNEEYAVSIFYDVVSQTLLNELENSLEELSRLTSSAKSKKKQAKQKINSLKAEEKELLFMLHDSLKEQKRDLENKLGLLKHVVSYLRSINGKKKRMNRP